MLLSVSAGFRGAGIVLLWVLGILMALLLLALFLPIRYEIRGMIEDPEAHEELQPEHLREGMSFQLRFSWLFHFVSGGFFCPGDPALRIRVLGFTVFRTGWGKEQLDKEQKPDKKAAPVRDRERRGKAGRDRETSVPHEADSEQAGESTGQTETPEKTTRRDSPDQSPDQSSGQSSVQSSAQGPVQSSVPSSVQERFCRAAENVRYYTEILRSDRFRRAIFKTSGQLKRAVRMLLPVKWRLSGTVGLGDPEKTGRLLSALALLWPFIRGHVELAPEFMAYRADVRGEAAGKIRLFTAAVCVLILYFDRDVRETLRLFRKENSENDGRAE